MTNEKKHFGVAGSHHLVMHAHIARLHIIPFPFNRKRGPGNDPGENSESGNWKYGGQGLNHVMVVDLNNAQLLDICRKYERLHLGVGQP